MKINVIEQFTLTMADGVRKTFNRGIQDVEEEIADHWFVKAHSEPVKDKEPEKDEAETGNKTQTKATKTNG